MGGTGTHTSNQPATALFPVYIISTVFLAGRSDDFEKRKRWSMCANSTIEKSIEV